MDRSIWVAIRPEFIRARPPKEEKAVPEVASEGLVVDSAPQTADVVEKTGGEEAIPVDEKVSIEAEQSAQQDDLADEDQASKKRKAEEQPKEKLTLKKRHGLTHPNKDDRLCSFVNRGEPCPHADCKYNHDALGYLANKLPDLGPSCLVYEKFGYCSNGLMCRFGASHIDYTTGTNLSRPAELGGVTERVHINILKKTVQLALRKRNYISNLPKPTNASSAPKPTAPTESTPPAPAAVAPLPYDLTPYPSKEVKLVDFSNKVYVAPLTTVGNLPFRRVIKDLGADITCSEMAMASNVMQAQASEWALLRRHQSEDIYGIQIAAGHQNLMADVCKVLEHETQSDFVDLNCGCPIDAVCSKGCGSSLLTKPSKLCDLLKTMASNLPSRSITVKVRIGMDEKHPTTHKLVPMVQNLAPGRIAAIMIHGRSKQQRYSRLANWEYVLQCARSQDFSKPLIPIIGNGDIFSYQDWHNHMTLLTDYHKEYNSTIHNTSGFNNISSDAEAVGLCNCAMIGRGVLVKPWLPLEIKEKALVDISANERLDILKNFCNYGLEHWGSDDQGINTTRRFLLEWLSFLHRYVPVGLLEYQDKLSGAATGSSNSVFVGMNNNMAGKHSYATCSIDDVYAQTMNQRPPHFYGRSDLETLLASDQAQDWIRISEMLLGKIRDDFVFIPKHKSNSYAAVGKEEGAGQGGGAEAGASGVVGVPAEGEMDNCDDLAHG